MSANFLLPVHHPRSGRGGAWTCGSCVLGGTARAREDPGGRVIESVLAASRHGLRHAGEIILACPQDRVPGWVGDGRYGEGGGEWMLRAGTSGCGGSSRLIRSGSQHWILCSSRYEDGSS